MSTDLARQTEGILDFQSGELISPADAPRVASYLLELRRLQQDVVRPAIAACEAALVEEAERQGTKTLHYGKLDAVVTEDKKIEWDIDKLADGLRRAGLPEDRLAEVIVETVTYKVKTAEANRLAAANPAYAEVVAASRMDFPGVKRVKVST